MSKIIIIAIVVAVVVGAGFLATRQNNDCETILSVERSDELVNSLDEQTSQFASSTKQILGRSTEGGVQIIYSNNGSRKIVEQRFYGETGRSYMRFYYEENDIFAIVKLNLFYNVPISVDSGGLISSSEEKRYYMDRERRVCRFEVNGVSQSVLFETQEMIEEHIAGIL